MKVTTTISVVIFAAAAGLLTGILLAPEKGSRTRRKMIEKGEDSFDDLKNSINHSVRDLKKKLSSSCPENTHQHKQAGQRNAEIIT